MHWLIGQSLYELNKLCPYCTVVWIVTIALF
ncbi:MULTISPECIES: vitamin K epoxide reductase family protein [Streptomyces]|uniref:Vitamin K epoxide reductase family protein n=1 Tax=Streptomyces sp. 900129855 TaxID=3155129 RepID=A0ABV2ZH28_9ACTN